jgi:hypothetical protein
MLERHNRFLRQSTIDLVINSISIKHSLQHFADDDSYIYAFGSKFKLVDLHQTKRASQLGTVPLYSTLTLCLTTTDMQLTPSFTHTCQLPATKLDKVGTLQGLTSPVSIQEIIYLLPETMQG